MRLSRSFAFLPTGTEHTDTSTDTPPEVERRRSSLDSFVIPRRTRFPSSKQDHQDTKHYDIVHTLFDNNQHTDLEQTRISDAVDAPGYPRKRRGFFPTSFNEENKIPTFSMASTKVDDKAKDEKPSPTFNGRSLMLVRGQQHHSADPSTRLNSLTATEPFRKSSSTYFSERPGSVRSAKEYNLLARQHKLPEFNYKNFHQNDPKLSCPDTKRQSFFGRLLSKRASTLQMTASSKTPALRHSRSTFNFLHIEGAYKDVLGNRSLEEISRVGGLHTLQLPREYAVEVYAVPTVVSAAIGYLLKHGLTTPGIFRISGQKTTIDALYTWYSNLCVDNEHDQRVLKTLGNGALPKHMNYNPHDVASLLKKFIGGLRGGLLGSVELFNTLNGALTNLERQPGQTEESFNALKAEIIALLISSIPNAKQMHLICAFFGLTAAIGEETKKMKASGISKDKTNELMGHKALGVVFGPLLLADLEAELDLGVDRVNTDRPAPSTPRRYWKEKRRSQVIDTKLEQDIRHRQALVRITAATNLANELLTCWKLAIVELQKIERRRNQEYLNQPSPAGSLYTLPSYQTTSFGAAGETSDHAQDSRDRNCVVSRTRHPTELVEKSPNAKQNDQARKSSDGRFLDILDKQQKVRIQPRGLDVPLLSRTLMFESHRTDAEDEMNINEALQRVKPPQPLSNRELQESGYSPRLVSSALPSVGHVQFLERTPTQVSNGAGNDLIQQEQNPSALSNKLQVTTSPCKRTFSSFRTNYLETPSLGQDGKPRRLNDVKSDQPESPGRSPPGLSHVDKIDRRQHIQIGKSSLLPLVTEDWVGKHMGSPTSTTFAEFTISPEVRKNSSASSDEWEHSDDRPYSGLTAPEVSETLNEGDEQSSQREDSLQDHLSRFDRRHTGNTSDYAGKVSKDDFPQSVHDVNDTRPGYPESTLDLYHDDNSLIEPTSRPCRQAKGSAEISRPFSESFDKFHDRLSQGHGDTNEKREKAKPHFHMNILSHASSTQTQLTNDPIQRDTSPYNLPRRVRCTPGQITAVVERPRQESFNKVKDRWVSWSSSSGGSSNVGSSDKAHREFSPVGVRDASLRKLFEVSKTQERKPRRESVRALAEKFAEKKVLPETTLRRPISIHRKPLPKTPAEKIDTSDNTGAGADELKYGSVKGSINGATKSSRLVSPSKGSRIPRPNSFNNGIRSSGKDLRHSVSPIMPRDPSPIPQASYSSPHRYRKSLFNMFNGSHSSLGLEHTHPSPTKRIKVDASKNLDRIMSASPQSIEGSVAYAGLPIPEPDSTPPRTPVSIQTEASREAKHASSMHSQDTFDKNEERGDMGKRAERDTLQVLVLSSAPPRRLPRDWVGSSVYRSPTSGNMTSQSMDALHHAVVDRGGSGMWDMLPSPKAWCQQQSRQTSTITHNDDNPASVPRGSLDTRSSSIDERSKFERRDARDYRNSILQHLSVRGMTLREYSASFRAGRGGSRVSSEVDGDEREEKVTVDSVQEVEGLETPTSRSTRGCDGSTSKRRKRLVKDGSTSSQTLGNKEGKSVNPVTYMEREKGQDVDDTKQQQQRKGYGKVEGRMVQLGFLPGL